MALFQKTVIKKYTQDLNSQKVQEAFVLFQAYFLNPTIQENIREAKEEQFQEGFLRELFGNILGYTLNPNPDFNLTTELKNISNSKKADGAILIDNKAIAVIELKGTDTTDLSKIEVQAFGYKNNQPHCTYVITSNFEKLRFYIDNAIEYIEFNLFTLTREDFNLLWLCLSVKSIEKNIPKKIKDESISQEDIITKRLYKDYSLFKRELYQDLVLLNPNYQPLELFKKSQKLLDRFLFLYFAEDRQLLPPNSVRLILDDWKDLQERDSAIPLYDRFKKYFEYLNTGYKGKRYDVFAYNGGLFILDKILDTVKINDDVLFKHTLKLSEYDFASEVDVNILGHIFENSLNELEEVKAQLEGNEIDKTKTKRKKDGVFYTPKYITKYIVENTVGKLCLEKKEEIQLIDEQFINDKKKTTKTKKELLDKLKGYRNWLLQLTICDPACGSGAFLNQALEFLINEHRYIDELQAKLLGATIIFSDIENSILENNLFGVDINEESVEIAQLSLWLRTAKRDRKLSSLNNNIKCGNSLIDDPEVAGEKAFNWEKEFPQIFGYTDISTKVESKKNVIESQPDEIRIEQLEIGDENNLAIIKYGITNVDDRLTNVDHRITNSEEPLAIYKRKKLGFDVVIGNPPYGAYFTEDQKNYISKNYKSYQYKFESYLYFFEKGISLLKNKGSLSYITPELFLRLEKSENIRKVLYLEATMSELKFCGEDVFQDVKVNSVITTLKKVSKNERLQNGGFYVIPEHGLPWVYSFDDWVQNSTLKIEYEISFAVKTIIVKIDNLSMRIEMLGDAIQGLTPYDSYRGHSEELIKSRGFHFKEKVDNYCGKWLDGKNINRYSLIEGFEWLRYGEWLAAPRDPKFFSGERLLFREVPGENKRIQATYTNKIYYHGHSITPFILKDRTENEILFIILGVVNSKLLSWYAGYKSSNFSKNTFPKLNPQDIKNLPIPNGVVLQPLKADFINYVKKILNLKEELQKTQNHFIDLLLSKFEIEKLSTKIQNWYELEFKYFLKELTKIKKLSLSQEAEWMNYFSEQKKNAQAIKFKIDATDKAIDQMVYDLYELTKEEIKIVEEK